MSHANILPLRINRHEHQSAPQTSMTNTAEDETAPRPWLHVEGRVFWRIRTSEWCVRIPALSLLVSATTLADAEDEARRKLTEHFGCTIQILYETGGRVLVSSPDAEAWGRCFMALLKPGTELILRRYP